MDYFRECFDRQVKATDEILRNFLNGPAPKEEEMQVCHICCQPIRDGELSPKTGLGTVHNVCYRNAALTNAAERRALARDAYMAALGTLGEYTAYSDLVTDCQTVALETVRRWDAFMAAVDAEGGE